MDFNQYKNNFEDKLFNACCIDIDTLTKSASHDLIITYCIYLPNGFEIFSSAACNLTGVKDALSMLADKEKTNHILKIKTSVDYWNIYEPGKSFDAVNQVCCHLFDELYNIEDQQEYLQAQDEMINFFSNSIINTILRLKGSHLLASPPFANDILMGLQYNDPTENTLEIMLKISEKVNSAHWHNKMLVAYQLTEI